MSRDDHTRHGRPRPVPGLSVPELARYKRHLALPEIGVAGQERLRASSVLVVGVGGLGCPAAAYLAAAGVGRLGLVDDDRVEESNLQRQILFGTSDVGRPKTEAAAERLSDLNPHVGLDLHSRRLTEANARELMAGYDVVVDGSDNFRTRYVVSDAASALGRPVASGSLERFHAQVAVFHPPDGPCYRCLFPEPPPPGLAPSCADAGVLGVLPGLVGVIQASEAMKLLLGVGRTLTGRLLTVDLLSMTTREFVVPKDPDCPACGSRRGEARLDLPEAAPCASDSGDADAIAPAELRERLDAGGDLVLLDVRMPWEWQRGHLEGAVLVPLSELASRMGELDADRETVVYCAVGLRSAHAVRILRAAGFARARNLSGGIEAWRAAVGPQLLTD